MADVYDVTKQNQTTYLDENGRPVAGVQVMFTSKPSGTVSSVTVPLVSFSADTVDRAIRAMVAQVEAVAAL